MPRRGLQTLATALVIPLVLSACSPQPAPARTTPAPPASTATAATSTSTPTPKPTGTPTPEGATDFDLSNGQYTKVENGKTYYWVPIQINAADKSAGHWFESRIAGAPSIPLIDVAANPYNPNLSFPAMIPMRVYFIQGLQQLTTEGYLYHPDGTEYYARRPGNENAWLAKSCSFTSQITMDLARRASGRVCGNRLCDPTSDEQSGLLRQVEQGALTLPLSASLDTSAKGDAAPRLDYEWVVSTGYDVYVVNWDDADPALDPTYSLAEAGNSRVRWKTMVVDGRLVSIIASSTPDQMKDVEFLYGVFGGLGAVLANARVDTGRYAFYGAANPSYALGKCSVRLVSTGATAHALPHIEILDNNVTPTPQPTPTLAPVVPFDVIFPSLSVVSTDTFDTANRDWWIDTPSAKLRQGLLQIDGTNWSGAAYLKSLSTGSGVAIDFQYKAGTVFAVMLDTGDFGTQSFKRFGIYAENDGVWTNIWDGKQHIESKNLTGSLVGYPDTWYSILLTIGKDGQFSMTLWNPRDPRQTIQYRETFAPAWSGLDWRFVVQADKGTLLVDNFKQISTYVTLTPPANPTAAPTLPVEAVFPGMQLVAADSFDDPQGPGWSMDADAAKIGDGVLSIDGRDWTGAGYDAKLKAGSAVAINFKFAAGSEFQALLQTGGAWDTPPFKRFGILFLGDHVAVTMRQGSSSVAAQGNVAGSLSYNPDTWYTLMMEIGKDGKFSWRVWNAANPNEVLEYRHSFLPVWSDLYWSFRIEGNTGSILLDDFRQFALDSK